MQTCVLLRKIGRQVVPFEPDYAGFEIPDEFVVGYGLDFNDEYRHLPFIAVLPEPRRAMTRVFHLAADLGPDGRGEAARASSPRPCPPEPSSPRRSGCSAGRAVRRAADRRAGSRSVRLPLGTRST